LSQDSVSAQDHGFLYGDGVYETVRCYSGRPAFWIDHLRRLRQSARLTGLRFPFTPDQLLKSVQRMSRRADITVRITLTRGPGPLGLDPALCPAPTLRLHVHPARSLSQWQQTGVSATVVTTRHVPPETLDPRIKSISLLPMVLAKAQARRRGAWEGLLLNAKGRLTEGTVSNLFWVRRGILYTPALSCGILPGITRAAVIRLARLGRIVVREVAAPASALRTADEIFLTNTSLEITPVIRLAGTSWRRPPGPVTRRLQEAYRRVIMARLFKKERAHL